MFAIATNKYKQTSAEDEMKYTNGIKENKRRINKHKTVCK